MRKQVKLLILALFASLNCQGEVNGETRSYNDWYQVEIIVFALQAPTPSEEVWPLTEPAYPARMIRISDENTLSPQTYEQLQQILAHNELIPQVDSDSDYIAPASDYLFASRSRYKVNTTPEPKATDPEVSTELDFDSFDPTDLDLLEQDRTGDSEAEQIAAIDLDQLFSSNKPQAFRPIRDEDRLLNKTARSINRSSLYRLLKHEAWLQPVRAADKAMPILIQAGNHFDEFYEVDGTITISRARFLHLDTDLWYTQFSPRFTEQRHPIIANISPDVIRQYPEVSIWENNRGNYFPTQIHKLVQSRRMRSSTLHYIDHPYFGILVQVNRFSWEPGEDFSD